MAKLFVSYSRRDSAAARKLIEAFRSIEQEVWVDWESIPPAVDWLEQIFRGIEESDAFLFMISPDSIASEVCKVEINRAAQNNKRIIPIVLRDVKPSDAPENIRKLNWTFLRESDNFEEGLAKVKTAIELDLDWLEEHRRLQVRSLEWHRKKDPSLLLRGRDLRNARHMLATATSKDPIPTDLQKTYILYSARNERNRTIAWIATGIALIIMAVLSYTTFQQSVRAARNEKVAVANAELAEEKRQEAEAARVEEEKQRQAAEEAREQEALQRERAVQNEIAAEAQRSAARAQIYLNRPGELYTSTLLAIDSMRRLPSDEAEEILRRNIMLLPTPVTQFKQAGKINALVFNPQGDTFFTASADGTTCAWEIEEETVNERFCTPTGQPGVNALALNPDGSSLVTGDQTGLVQVLDPATGEVLHAFQRVGPASGQTEIADVENGVSEQQPTGMPVRTINIRPTRERKLVVTYDDGQTPIFDPITGKLSARISSVSRPYVSGLSPNGAWLVTGSENGRVSILNLTENTRFSPTTHRGGVLAMAFSPLPANNVATAGNDTIAMINMSIEKELYRIPIQSPVRDIAFSPDGSWFVTGSDDHRIRVWETLTGNERLGMSQDGIVTEVVVSSDGKWIASTGDDRTARVWNAVTGAEMFQIPLKASGARLSFANEDTWLISTDASGNIAIWDISGVTLPQASLSFDAIVDHVQYSPSGEWLALSSRDKVWVLKPDPESLSQLQAGQPVLDFNANITKLVFSPDASALGVLTEENEVALYHVAARARQEVAVETKIQSIAFSPDSQQFIASDLDGTIQAWDAGSGALFSEAGDFPQGTSLASAGEVLAVGSQDKLTLLSDGNGALPTIEFRGDNALLAVSPDGSWIASSSSAGETTIFQYDGSQLTRVASVSKGQVTSLAFHPDGTLLAMGTARNVYLLDTKDGKELARIPHLSTVNGVSFSADGSYLATASSQTLQFWELSQIQQITSNDLIPATCSHLFENFSTAQWGALFAGEEYQTLCESLPVPE